MEATIEDALNRAAAIRLAHQKTMTEVLLVVLADRVKELEDQMCGSCQDQRNEEKEEG